MVGRDAHFSGHHVARRGRPATRATSWWRFLGHSSFLLIGLAIGVVTFVGALQAGTLLLTVLGAVLVVACATALWNDYRQFRSFGRF